ncbi:spore germination protein [Peribacillus muralis]|uniref:spore germination protein n=1 Tax=Peribacillus muralis TaxID=264697 RepID=UPI00070FA261|nr:spore germination protein [Peribacillus muralis]MCK1992899.1 spore germination protein [Peribacillus muralis]MCK2013454.1 spore germination protein [Peribacillus muralis]
MPAIVGPIQIFNVGSGNLLFGDAAVISPKSSSKSVTGSGSGNTGAIVFTANGLNGSNVLDINGIDQPITGNN